MRNPRPDQEK